MIDEEVPVDREAPGRDTAIDEHGAGEAVGDDLREVPTHEILGRGGEVTAVDAPRNSPQRARLTGVVLAR